MSQILCDRSHIRTYIRLVGLAKNMKNIAEVLLQKEIELARAQIELDALKISVRLLEEQASQADEPPTLTTFASALDRRSSDHRSGQ